MTKEELVLKKNIMMRVRFIYGVKSLPRIFVPKIALLATLVAVAGFFVSFPNVLKNMPSFLEITKFTEFTVTAFFHAKLVIQTVFVGTLILLGYIARDIIQVFHASVFRSIRVAK